MYDNELPKEQQVKVGHPYRLLIIVIAVIVVAALGVVAALSRDGTRGDSGGTIFDWGMFSAKETNDKPKALTTSEQQDFFKNNKVGTSNSQTRTQNKTAGNTVISEQEIEDFFKNNKR